MSFGQLIPTFNAGELSPYLDARSDIEKYASGCRLLENFVIMPYGGVYRRPGTEYLGTAKYANKRCRLVPFNFSVTTKFVLELGDRYMRFWSNGRQVEHVAEDEWVTAKVYVTGDWVLRDGVTYFCLEAHTSDDFAGDLGAGKWEARTIVEVASPYEEGELREVQYLQINDVMYLAHPAHGPRKLSRYADYDWRLEEAAWDWPALLDENVSQLTLQPSDRTGEITLTVGAPDWVTGRSYAKGDFVSSDGLIYVATMDHTGGSALADDLALARWKARALFETGHIGSRWQIAHAREKAFISYIINYYNASVPSDTIPVLGSWDFTTYGRWKSTVILERSRDGGATWEIVRSYSSDEDKNVITSGKELREVLFRIRLKDYVLADGEARALLEIADVKDYGIVKITGVADDGLSATGVVVNDLFGTDATAAWSEGAWSVKRGFPRAVALHEQRIYYAGTAYRPLTVWGSVIDDFENFRLNASDDAGLFFSLSAQEANPIQWMTSQDRLLIGTAGEEWTLGSSDQNGAITPSNVQAVRQSSYGSKALRAMVVNEVILFVQRQGRKVRELVYSYEKDGWVAPDLTVLAEHVTRGEILECAFQQQPDAIYWTVTGAGQLVGMTYERDQNVVGWHRHTTEGVFESVASVYGASGADEVWVAVQRVIKGQPRRYIERFKVDFREAFEAEDRANWWYLDCARVGGGVEHPNEVLAADGIDMGWTTLPSNRAISVSVTNTASVEIVVKAQGKETVVPVGETVKIAGLRNTDEVQYRAMAHGVLVFDNVKFRYGTDRPTSQALSVSLPLADTPTDGYVIKDNVVLDEGWTLRHLRLDATQNKIDELYFQRDGISWWTYNYGGLSSPHTENQFPAAGSQTLGIDASGFVGGYPLYYDEDGHYDLTYAGDVGSNTERESSGTVRYVAASAPEFTYEPNATYVTPGLDHLEGETVEVLADGAVAPASKVSAGTITLQDPAERVLAGLPYVSRLQPMKSEMALPDGTSRSRKKRVNRVAVSLYKSLGGKVSTNGTDWNWIYSRSFGDPMDSAPPVLTGDHEVIVAGGNRESVDVTIRQAQPLPLTVLGVVVKYEAHGD